MADANPPDHLGPLSAASRPSWSVPSLVDVPTQALLDDDCLNGKVTLCR